MRHGLGADKAGAYLSDLIHVRRRLGLWGALLAGLAVLAEAGAAAVDAAIAFPVGKLDAPTSVPHFEKGTRRKAGGSSLWRPLGFLGWRRAWRVLRSKATLRRAVVKERRATTAA